MSTYICIVIKVYIVDIDAIQIILKYDDRGWDYLMVFLLKSEVGTNRDLKVRV